MDHPEPKNAPPSDQDGGGVRITGHAARGWRSDVIYKSLALILAGCSAGYVLMNRNMLPDPPPDPSRAEAAAAAAGGADRVASDTPPPGSPQTTAVPRREPTPTAVGLDGLAGRDLSEFIPPGEPPPMAEVIDQLHKAGIHSGIGAFPPPGTSPPLVGLAVPEDYVLPEGYVRHFQATDDGQRIEPILMYSPDFDFFDASGKPIAIPPDRVVPPGMAPPGLATRRIEIPPPLQPGRP
jgi:hypothetical protein